MKKRINIRLFNDKRFILPVSFVLAFLSWVVVAGFVNPGETLVLSNVTIDYEQRAEDYRLYDLQIVTDLTDLGYAEVQVSGDTSLISGFSDNDVDVYADYSAVVGPGTYNIPLEAIKTSSGSYNIQAFSLQNGEHSLDSEPATTVSLTFEEVQTRTFPVVVQASDITAASGYFKDTAISSQSEVTLTGPASEMAKVVQVVAVVEEREERVESGSYTVPLMLLDAEGNSVVSSGLSITPVTEVEVTVPILEIREVGLDVGLIGYRQGFDIEWVESLISLSADSIEVVGSSQAFSNLQNPFTVAEIDISDLGLGWELGPLDIELPEGLRSQSPAEQVMVDFEDEGLVERVVRVTNLSVANAPPSLDVEPISEGVNVTLIGPEEQMNEILPENILVEVDAYELTATSSGQQALPARVLVPSKDRVFATGQYSVVCDIGVSG